ncbi:hypothetical protein [Streptomyces sp. NPDC055287]
MPLTPGLAAFLAPPAPARLPLPPTAHPAPGVRLLRGVPYAVRAGIRPLELDLWLPDGARGPLPVVVHLHGGGWRAGTRTEMGPRFRGWRPDPFARLAQAGFAVASVREYVARPGAPREAAAPPICIAHGQRARRACP